MELLLDFQPHPFVRPDPKTLLPHCIAAGLDPDAVARALSGSSLARSLDREREMIRALAPLETELQRFADLGAWRPGGASPFITPIAILSAILSELATSSSAAQLNPADVGATIDGVRAIAGKFADRKRLTDAINEAVTGGVTPRAEAELRAQLEPVVGSLAAALLTRHEPDAAQRTNVLVTRGDPACREELGRIGATAEPLFAEMLGRHGDAPARVASILAADLSDPSIIDRLVARRTQERIEAARRAELAGIETAVRRELGAL